MANIPGTPGDDILSGTNGDDLIEGYGGNDSLNGGAGNDSLQGGDGAYDWALHDGATSAISVNMLAGTISGWSTGNDTISGIENIGGTEYADYMIGNEADNLLQGRGGDDYLDGGAGMDTADYFHATGGVMVDIAAGTATGADGQDILLNFENIGGSGYGDVLLGNGGMNYINGQGGDDYIDGRGGVDWVFYDGATAAVRVDLAAGSATGGLGSDTLVSIENVGGSIHDDILLGDGGDNVLQGRAGNDTLDGGGGFDTVDYYHSTGGVSVNLATNTVGGADGVDRISNFEAVTGSWFDDHLVGNAGDNMLAGLGGDDYIDGGLGHDFVGYWEAGSGVVVDLLGGHASGGSGSDVLVSIEAIGGSSHDDILIGDGGDNGLHGAEGNDQLFGNGGDDYLEGGAGDDLIDGGGNVFFGDNVSYFSSTGGVVVDLALQTAYDGMGGNDIVRNIEHIDGSMFDDRLTGDFQVNWFRPHAGNDVVNGAGGQDVVMYESSEASVNVDLRAGTATGAWIGNDALASIEAVHGSRHDDFVQLSDVAGDPGRPTQGGYVFGRSGNDILLGGALDDNFIGGRGDDTIDGGAGGDNVSYFDDGFDGFTGLGVTVNLGTGIATDNYGNTDRLSSIEGVSGTEFGDVITGGAAAQEFFNGNGGNDRIDGAAGSDYVDGGAGDDVLGGGADNDHLVGGRGNDAIDGGAGTSDSLGFYDDGMGGGARGVTVNLGAGTAIDNYGHADTLAGIEGVNGTDFADVITGGNAPQEFFSANGGDDVVDGAGGNDFINGGAGDDTLYGGAGSDTFVGGAGNDRIDGGTITDLINYADLNSVDYSSSGAGIVLNLATGVAQDGMGGTDQLANINWVVGSSHADRITGSSGPLFEQFDGGLGNDVIDGGAIDPVGFGNANRVTYANSGAAVSVDLALGQATGGMGNDTLVNINHVFGSRFADTLLGSDSAIPESFNGRGGNDFIDGRGGIDEVRYTNAGRAVNVNLAAGTATDGELVGGAIGNDTLRNIEGVRGSNFGDTLVGGNAGSDDLEFFMGMAGDDLIDGGSGYDRVDYTSAFEGVNVTLGGTGTGTAFDGLRTNGVQGKDTLLNVEAVRGSTFADVLTGSDSGAFESFEGREGADIIDGKGGIDRVDYQSAGSGVTVDLTAGTGHDGSGSVDSLSNIENVRGSTFNDRISGNDAANLLQGGAGNDTISGGAGNDVLGGGVGNDALAGGAGDDQFLFEASGNGIDTIADFAGGDTLLVGGTITGRATAGNGGSLAAGAMQASTSNGITTLYIGTDSVAGADVEIRFNGTIDPGRFLALASADGYTSIGLADPQGNPSRVAELAVQIRATSVAHADVAGNVAGHSTTNPVAVSRLLEALERVNLGADAYDGGGIGGDIADVPAAVEAPWGVMPQEVAVA